MVLFESLALGAQFSTSVAPYLAAFMIGFLGGGHCIGMCGGVMAALSFAIPADQPVKRWRVLLSYNIGRIFSYVLIGALAGGIGFQLSSGHGLSILRIIAGILLIAMGLYLANWWRGLSYLESLGGVLWRRLQPLGKSLMPVKSSRSALMLGMLWGWLPCGLVYTALAYGLARASMAESAGVMLAFGLGTLPAVLASGVFAERIKHLMQLQRFRITMALLIMAFGVWTLWGTYQHTQHMGHGAAMDHSGVMDHGDHSQSSHSMSNHESMTRAQDMHSHEAMADHKDMMPNEPSSMSHQHHAMDEEGHGASDVDQTDTATSSKETDKTLPAADANVEMEMGESEDHRHHH